MSTTRTHRRLAATALLLALAVTGCGERAATPAAAPTARTPFSQELHDALPAEVRAAGRLEVLASAGYAPVLFYGPDGHVLQGSEADLARSLGRVLGVDVEFVPAAFPTILERLAAGEADLGMSGITDTAVRQQQVDFVDYFQAGTAILVQRGNRHDVAALADLCGKRVSVGEGTTQQELAHRLAQSCAGDPLEVVAATNAADAMLELRSGSVDATLVDYPPAAHMAGDPRARAHFELATEEQHETAPFGIAVSRHREGLLQVVRDALVQVRESGEYDEVLRTWNLQAGAVDEVGVNAGT